MVTECLGRVEAAIGPVLFGKSIDFPPDPDVQHRLLFRGWFLRAFSMNLTGTLDRWSK